MGHLRSIQGVIEERDLNALILKVTKNSLHTTRESRQELARASSNLLVLRNLLENLQSHVNRDKRNWVHYDDVATVEAVFRERLISGRKGR